ncbi:transmembrane protein 116 isoform X1 [Triplophysa rosa]|uniref:transmembrane protein 116 isoform X1 n=2 Tax=Triplophysa rosa TaxID=992332 RepID=UPI0025460C24|nr:transmembrane protein 116 isoform X1 [Triplophysa rosa]
MNSVVMNSSGGWTDKRISALSGVYVSCLSLSLLGSCSVIVVSILRRSHLSVQAKPLLQLALADFLASAVLMGTIVINFLSYDTLPVKTSEKLCNYGLPLSLTFYCISFLLVIIYAFESAYVFQGWRERAETEGFENQSLRRRRMFCLFYITVWLVPIIGYIVYVKTVTVMQATLTPPNKLITYVSSAPDTARFCDSCILFLHITNDTCPTVDPGHAEFIQVFTLTSVMTVLVCCTVVYWKLQSWYRNYKSTTMFRLSQNHPGGIWSSARYMILVIIFCWAPGLLLVSLSFASSTIRQNLFPLYVIQAMSVSLQGFLNSIVYAWRRRNFRDAVLGERMPLMAYSQKAFFDQSLNDPLGH